MAEAARVHTIPAGVPFADALATGLLARAANPLALADIQLLLPTRRACRAVRNAFLRVGDGRALLLPRLVPIGDVDEDVLDAEDAAIGLDAEDVPPAITPLRRQFLLARLVLRAQGALDVGGPERAMRLAAELARLLDDAQTAGVDLAGLVDLAPATYAEHWQRSLAFLGILTEHWPRVLAEHGVIDPADRRNRLLARQAARWRAAPPAHPVVVAGSTGSVPAAADLIAAASSLPTGLVVLAGLDQAIDEESWQAIGVTHPQAALKRLLERLGLGRDQVAPWPHGDGSRAAARARLLGDALRPAATLGAWRTSGGGDDAALAGLARVDGPTPQVEAGVIAGAMREALETPGATAALVTRDRALARRVAEALGRWGVAVDDSAGRPLAATPPGAFLRLAAAMAESNVAPVPLLALLKHPLAAGGGDPARFRAAVRAIERVALRGPRPAAGFDGLVAALADKGTPRLRNLARRVARAGHRFVRLAGGNRPARLGDLVEAHVAFAEALAATDEEGGADRLWRHEDGEALAAFIGELREASQAMGRVRGADYAGVFDTLIAGRAVRPRYGRHARLAIWGPLEARLQSADLMILGGLNEGSWPPAPDLDPWLSRPMRASLGLADREARIGQAAHDFVLGAAAPRVLLTRAEKVEGTPTVASRWLVRLDALLAARGLSERPFGGAVARLGWHAALDRPDRVVPVARPRPAPPVAARPRRVSVTDIETWLADPYALYARAVLGLAALDPIDADPGAAERGQFIHDALDRFVKAWPDALPDDALDQLIACGRAAFGAALERPDVHAFWWPRFKRIAAWIVEQERERRGGIARVLGEARGRAVLDAPAGPFELHAKADRVEVNRDGSLALIDYKTGVRPANKAAREGKAPQLALEGVIANHGGFEGVAPGPLAELAFWHLKGGDPAGEAIAPKGLVDACAQTEDALKGLVRRFDDPATPYLACPRPDMAPAYNDYEELERIDEGEATPSAVPPYRPRTRDRPRAGARAPRPEQRDMSDPATSAWVAASAGTGKTTVLTDRVLRLLAGGTPPGRLLCLTFTKAAAAEMAQRIERHLGHWATEPDDALAASVGALLGAPPAPEVLDRARRLFADVLETPGGLPIMTIHAFCQAVLERFPVEAGVAPGFEVLDPCSARELQADALDAVIARSKSDPLLNRHVATVATWSGEMTLRALMDEVTLDRGRFDALLRRHGRAAGAAAALRRTLGVVSDDTIERLIARTADPAAMDEPALAAAARALREGSVTNQELSAAIAAFLATPAAARHEDFDAWYGRFLTKEEKPRKTSILINKAVAQRYPAAVAALERERDRMVAFVDERNRVITAEATAALFHVGEAFLAAYAARKAVRGVLDYQDLILAAADLVTRPGAAPWVLYKLDGGIDHILVDEAQDTNPDQWRIVTALVDEFFAGEGARETPHTLFVVGDQKQSIFSFQGADLEGLASVHHDLRQRANAAGVPWLERAMTHSFRSAPVILEVVDTVFARPEARAGVVPDGAVVRHVAGRSDAPGRVEVWPLTSGDPPAATSPWDAPIAYPGAVRAIDRLAAHVADRIAAMVGRVTLGSRGQPVRPGDIMILVRRRDAMMHAVIRALRRRDVPVAGIDRIALTGPLAVRDLLGLIDVALLPEDDLALATVLKGPLVGLDEDELYTLAAGRAKGVRLWTALGRAARRHARCARAHQWLAGLMARADLATPYGFLCAALEEPAAQEDAGSGRHAMLRRLGLEAEDHIDELLTQALAFERNHAPTLQGFAHWLGHADVEVTRDPEHGRDEVRVLTVHGAKGLEAPIVILPDTTGLPNASGVRLDWIAEDGPLWSGRAAFAEDRGRGAKQARLVAEAAEYRRLLYVALTRAADHLIVAGLAVKGTAPDGSWYRLVRDALGPVATVQPFDAWPGDAFVLEAEGRGPGPAEPGPAPEPDLPALPAWLRQPAPVDAPARQPLAPSRGPEEPPSGSPKKADADRRRRGRLIHRLLELLPTVAPSARARLAERLLVRHGADLDVAARAAMVAEVLAVMAAPGLVDLFGPQSRAEVPIVGVVGDRVVAGQVDRLVVGAGTVVIADFKSDRAVPDQVPAAYRHQMAHYAAVLRQVFPRHRVSAVLIWTEGPRVMPVPDLA